MEGGQLFSIRGAGRYPEGKYERTEDKVWPKTIIMWWEYDTDAYYITAHKSKNVILLEALDSNI